MTKNNDCALICAADEPGAQRVESVAANGFEDYNKAIEADVGDVVAVHSITQDIPKDIRDRFGIRSVDMWIDDEGRLKPDAVLNVFATIACKQPIYGHVMVMCSNAQGDSFGLPAPILAGIRTLVDAVNTHSTISDAIVGVILNNDKQWFKETGGTGFKIIGFEEGGEK